MRKAGEILHRLVIENGDLDIIPPTYLRLFISSYAQHLDMDNKTILKQYGPYGMAKSEIINY